MSSDAGTREITVPLSPQSPGNLRENPPWTGWDVVYIVMVMFASLLICLIGITILVKKFAYPGLPFFQVMSFPLVAFGGQMASYLVTLGFMFVTATHNKASSFGTAVRWNWPKRLVRILRPGQLRSPLGCRYWRSFCRCLKRSRWKHFSKPRPEPGYFPSQP